MRMPVFLIGLWQGLCRKVQLIWKETAVFPLFLRSHRCCLQGLLAAVRH